MDDVASFGVNQLGAAQAAMQTDVGADPIRFLRARF